LKPTIGGDGVFCTDVEINRFEIAFRARHGSNQVCHAWPAFRRRTR
jgi:hypothetical protein